MKLSRWRAQSNNFAGSVVGGGGVAHGPTVQIARSPSSITAANGTTGTLTAGTPEDVAGVATGVQTYLKSDNSAVARVDNAVAHTYTLIGSTGQTANLYEELTPPAAVGDGPIAYNAALHDMILAPDFDSMSSWADVVAGGGRSVGQSTTDDSGHNQFLTDGDGHKFVRVLFDGTTEISDPTDEVHNFSYATGGINPNGGKAGRKIHIRFKMRWHSTDVDLTAGNGIHSCIVYKNFELYASGTPGATGRAQFATAGLTAGRGTNYIPYTPTSTPRAYDPANNSFPLICFFGNSGSNTTTQCFQTNGPFLHETIVDNWADVEVQYMTMTPNTGTVNVLLQTADVVFAYNQTGVLANGNYITIPNSTGEFQISNFVASNGGYSGLSTATLTRSGSTGHTLTTYTPGWWSGGFIASSIAGTCSASQNAESTFAVGEYIRFNRATATQAYPYTITAFNGTTGFTASSVLSDARLFDADETGLVFSTKNDGEALYFINGTLVSACAKRYAGVVNPGDVSGTSQVWCQLLDPATMYVDDNVGELAWAGNLQGNFAHHGSDYRAIQVFVDK